MVSSYSPTPMTLFFRSETFFLVGLVLSMTVVAEHWKRLRVRRSMMAKSTLFFSPSQLTDFSLVHVGVTRSTI